MSFQFTHPGWLLLLVPVLLWTLGLVWKSDASLVPWRRYASTALRLIVVLLLVFGIAGIQWKKPQEGMNAFFLLDRSDSIPSGQQEQARDWANRWAKAKRPQDKAGFLVFGSDAALETTATSVAEAEKIQAVVGGERTDLAGAIRLGTAAFPEAGQKRLVLFSDGNENVGDAMAALLAAKPLGVSLDVVPLGVTRGDDVAVQKLGLPANVKKGQTFDAKIFATSDRPRDARVRLYRNDQMLGEQKVHLDTGKNLFTFPQTLAEPGFYSYQVQVEADGDTVPQNNKAAGFVNVRGDPRVLLVSSDPAQDRTLAAALRSGKLDVQLVGLDRLPATLAEMQSYDELILSNVSAGDLGRDRMAMLQSAVRDFGVGLVVIGGDQAFGAGGYRGTALEETLPVDMELNSKKVLPKGALALVMHGMEFANGNQVAREIGVAALDALGPQDELGVWLWDGIEKALFDLQPVGNKQKLATEIMGMNQGDLPSFQGLMTLANASLQKSSANLKHMVVFSDGDPNAPAPSLMQDIVAHKITVTTVMIGGHVQPTTMIQMAEQGKGRFYDVKSAAELPQIFIKEASVILKSAIVEEPFRPQIAAGSELIRGLGGELPIVRGYVATTSRPRAETPLVSDKGDPLLAHWQYGLGRSVAYTSDARAKWGQDWILGPDRQLGAAASRHLRVQHRGLGRQRSGNPLRRGPRSAGQLPQLPQSPGRRGESEGAAGQRGSRANRSWTLRGQVSHPRSGRVSAQPHGIPRWSPGVVAGGGYQRQLLAGILLGGAQPESAEASGGGRRRQDAGSSDRQSVRARPPEDLPAARSLGGAAQVVRHPLCARCGGAPCGYRPGGMAQGVEPAARGARVRRCPAGRGRAGIAGSPAAATRPGARNPSGSAARGERTAFPTATSPGHPTRVWEPGRIVPSGFAGSVCRVGFGPRRASKRGKTRHHQPSVGSQTPRPASVIRSPIPGRSRPALMPRTPLEPSYAPKVEPKKDRPPACSLAGQPVHAGQGICPGLLPVPGARGKPYEFQR